MSNRTAVKVGSVLVVCWFLLSTWAVTWRKSAEGEKRTEEKILRRHRGGNKEYKKQHDEAIKILSNSEGEVSHEIEKVYSPYRQMTTPMCDSDRQSKQLYWLKRDYESKLNIPSEVYAEQDNKLLINSVSTTDIHNYKKAGLHCFEIINESGPDCVVDSSFTAVQHHSRKGTEYGIELFEYPKFYSIARPVALSLDMSVQLIVPSSYVEGYPIPVFAVVHSSQLQTPFEWAAVPIFLSLTSQGDVHRESNLILYRGITSFWGIQEGVQPPPASPSQRETITVGSTITARLSTSRDAKKSSQLVGESAVATFPSLGSKNAAISWKQFLDLRSDSKKFLIIEILEGEDAVIPEESSITIPPGTVILMGKNSMILVKPKATLALIGTAENPISMISSIPGSAHCGLFVEQEAEATVSHLIASGSGCLRKRPKDTGKHRKSYPLFSSRGRLTTSNVYALELHGPGYGLADSSVTRVENNILTGLEQGGECVFCNITMKQTYIGSLPDDKSQFVDEDNDGFYFRGGSASIETLVVANSKDDCIDSASSKGHAGGILQIKNSILHNCLHEGVALSGSQIPSPRQVIIKNTIIFGAQQGIEIGHSPKSHSAIADVIVFSNCQVGIRIGDNYNLKVEGVLVVSNSLLQSNAYAVRNFTKLPPHHQDGILRISNTLFQSDAKQQHCGSEQWTDAGNNHLLHSDSKPIVDPLTAMVNIKIPPFEANTMFDIEVMK